MRIISDHSHTRCSSGEVILHRRHEWDGFTAELVRRTGMTRQEIQVGGDKHAIFLNLEGAARTGENFIDGSRTSFAARPEGTLAYIPPGRVWTGWDDGDDTAAYLFLSVEQGFAESIFEDRLTAIHLRPELGFHDLAVQFAARNIAAELHRIDDASGLIVEGSLTTIFGHLARRSYRSDRPTRGGLAPAVLRRVLDKLGDSHEEGLTLTDLCRELGLSTAHFSRAFKQSTGVTPHAYFNRRRLDRASRLLRTTSLTVTEIAFICGYASASHLSTSFRQELAVPPKVYRSVWRMDVKR